MAGDAKFSCLVEAVVYIAINAKPNAVRGPEICRAQGLPERYLESSLQQLVRGNILRSVRGPKGGYVLAKERRNVTVADIYKNLMDEKPKQSSALDKILAEAEQSYISVLAKTTIEELCNKSAEKENSSQKPDFTI